jgi:hypothetical protein
MCECGHVEDEHLDVNANEGQKCLGEYEGYEVGVDPGSASGSFAVTWRASDATDIMASP